MLLPIFRVEVNRMRALLRYRQVIRFLTQSSSYSFPPWRWKQHVIIHLQFYTLWLPGMPPYTRTLWQPLFSLAAAHLNPVFLIYSFLPSLVCHTVTLRDLSLKAFWINVLKAHLLPPRNTVLKTVVEGTLNTKVGKKSCFAISLFNKVHTFLLPIFRWFWVNCWSVKRKQKKK